jgi:hypothetical protein
MVSFRHLLAGLAAGPVLLVARTLSYLLGNHETFRAFRLGAQVFTARQIIVAGLVKYFDSEISCRHPRTRRLSNTAKRSGAGVPRGETGAWDAAR